MNKKLIALAVAGAFAAPMTAQAAMDGVSVSGFVDVILTVSDEASDVVGPPAYNPVDSSFAVPEAEVDFEGGGVRLDINGSSGGNTSIEQANFTHDFGNGWALVGGTFNSGITGDMQDAPDMHMTSNSLTFNTASAVGAINLSGLAAAGKVGPANVTVAYVNDPSNNGTSDHENSLGLIVSGTAMEGLDLEFGYLGQDKGVGDLMNINGMYTMGGLSVGLDYLSADPLTGSSAFDDGYSFIAGYDLGNGLVVKARVESASFEGAASKDTDVTSIFAAYSMSDNLTVALENTSTDNGTTDTSKTTVEFIGTF